MRFNLYIHGVGEPIFIQAAHDISGLQKGRQMLSKWVSEMGVAITDPTDKNFVIYDNGVPHVTLPYASQKKIWKPYIANT